MKYTRACELPAPHACAWLRSSNASVATLRDLGVISVIRVIRVTRVIRVISAISAIRVIRVISAVRAISQPYGTRSRTRVTSRPMNSND